MIKLRRSDRRAGALSRDYLAALRAGNADAAERVATRALEQGMSHGALFSRVFAPAMEEIGEDWAAGRITVADEHLATAITQRVLASIYGRVPGRPRRREKVMLAGIEGQVHVLGLRMAADVLERAGFDVLFLGADVPCDDLEAAVERHRPDLVGLSITMPLGAPLLEQAVAKIEQVAPRTPIVFGGRGVPRTLRDRGALVLDDLEGIVPAVEGAIAEGGRPLFADRPPPPAAMGATRPEMVETEARLAETVAGAADIARAHARLADDYRRLAYEDALSGLPNRRAFDDRIADLAGSADAAPLALLMIDVDRFKRVNDEIGHPAGDHLLTRIGDTLRDELREEDFAARFGGDEFVVLLPRAGVEHARELGERLRAAIESRLAQGEVGPVTISVGVAPVEGDARRALFAADAAMYEAKDAGRNAVRVSG